MTIAELEKEIVKQKEELKTYELDVRTAVEKDTSKIKKMKKNIARAYTFLNAKKIEAEIQKIVDKVKDTKEEIKEEVEDVKDEVKEKAEEVKKEVSKKIKDIKK